MTVRTAKIIVSLATDKENQKKIFVILILILFLSSSCISCTSCTTMSVSYMASTYNSIDTLNKKVEVINNKIEDNQTKIDSAFYISSVIYYYNSILDGTKTFYKPEILNQVSSEQSSGDKQSILLIETIGDDFLLCFYEIKEMEIKEEASNTNSKKENQSNNKSSSIDKKKKTKMVYTAYSNKNEIFKNIEKVISCKLDENDRNAINSYSKDAKEILNDLMEKSNAELSA